MIDSLNKHNTAQYVNYASIFRDINAETIEESIIEVREARKILKRKEAFLQMELERCQKST